ncbi:MAG: hypothetical protein WCA59_12640 [Candidatus Binataceae bacterium]
MMPEVGMEVEAANNGGGALEPGGAARPAAVSLLRYSPALVVFIIAITDVGRWADPDLWGHIRFGQLALTLGHAPVRNPYSYSAPGYLWRDPEWLAEALLALAYDTFGIVGLKLMKFAATAVTVLLMALAAAESRASVRIQLVVLTMAGVALIPMMQFRPQLFTFMLLSALIVLLARDSFRPPGASIWLALPIFALWANTHGGVAAGFAAMALYAAVRGLEDLAGGRGPRTSLRLGGVTLACAAATLVNPYGFGNWLAVERAIRNPMTRAFISEWQPMMFKMAEQWHESPAVALNYGVVIALPLALAVCFAIRPRGDDLALVAIAALMALGAWLSVRNMALAVIVTVAPLCRHAGLVFEKRRFGDPAAIVPRQASNEILVGALALLIVLQSGLFSRTLIVQFGIPKGAVDFMQAHELRGNLLADFSWGDYLIWRMAPASKVFIDGRYDFAYPMPVIRDYFDFKFDSPRAAAVLDSYPHDYVLMTPASPVRELMERRPDWKLIYSDPRVLMFARADSPAAHLDGVPVQGRLQPQTFP